MHLSGRDEGGGVDDDDVDDTDDDNAVDGYIT